MAPTVARSSGVPLLNLTPPLLLTGESHDSRSASTTGAHRRCSPQRGGNNRPRPQAVGPDHPPNMKLG